jgi:hypothetical protein
MDHGGHLEPVWPGDNGEWMSGGSENRGPMLGVAVQVDWASGLEPIISISFEHGHGLARGNDGEGGTRLPTGAVHNALRPRPSSGNPGIGSPPSSGNHGICSLARHHRDVGQT